MIHWTDAAGIAGLLDRMPALPDVLSLDCFDTLLWRNVHAPADIFAELPRPGGAAYPRCQAETLARHTRKSREGVCEVSIEAIYARMELSAEASRLAVLRDAELAAEARHCFAFAPVVALIDAARAAGVRVIVVSDTYLSAVQLRALIAAAAGQDVADRIDTIFCSSEYGRDKAHGLFESVLDALNVPPAAILHLGDNPVADRDAPAALGINAVHFRQFGPEVQQQLRFEAAIARIIEPATGVTTPTMQPHRAALSLYGAANPIALLGHDVLGPIMLGFARWVKAEAEALAERTGRPVKPLFLMRDGHLPSRMFAAAGLGDFHTAEISRFTARRASFTDADAIRRYLEQEPSTQVAVLGRQMLLNPAEIARIGRDDQALRNAVVKRQWVETITRRSAHFANRLAAHVRDRADVRSGDILMMVDLGYFGSVQDLSHAAIAERLDVDIVGRYLLLTEILSKGLDKKGLLDTRHYDHRTLMGLIAQVSALEQMCSIGHGSVVDYRFDGAPRRRPIDITPEQIGTRDAVQTACLAYVDTAHAAKHRVAASDGPDAERRMVAATLVRYLLLPRAQEVSVLRAFNHDINLGTSETSALMAADKASMGLRHRGVGYLRNADRMFISGELQAHGLPLSLSLLTMKCLGMDFWQSDFLTGSVAVPVMLVGAGKELMTTAAAHPTHDGYHLLAIDLQAHGPSIGISIGRLAEIVQIESICAYTLKDYASGRQDEVVMTAVPIMDGMEALGEGVYRCTEAALIFVPPIAGNGEPMVLTLVFRPIIPRPAGVQLREAA